MLSQKLNKLAWFFIPVLLSAVALVYLFFIFPQQTKAQSALEFTVTPEEQSIIPGSLATFNIAITNTGPISLTNIFVDANLLPCRQSPIYNTSVIPAVPLVLGIGKSYSYICGDILNVDIDETVTISAEATDSSSTVSDSADVVVHVEHLSANFGTEFKAVPYGDSTQLTLYITNSGEYDLTNISVTPRDAAFSDCVRTAGQLANLAGGQSTSFSCWSPNISSDSEVIFDLAATLDGSMAVSEIAYLFLDSTKGLELEISPDVQMIAANSTANLTVRLSNPDSLPATNITVASPDFPACSKGAGSIPDLLGGESYEFQCRSTELSTDGTYTLTASATTNNLAVTAVAHTTINANSSVEIDVQPSYLIVAESKPVTFTVTVTNNLATETLTDVNVNTTPVTYARDATRPSGAPSICTRVLADMAPGAVVSYTCERIAFPGEPQQTFTVSGFTPALLEDGDANYHFDTAEAYVGLMQTLLPVMMNKYQRPFTYPDLTISSMSVNKITNNTYSINITVKNQSTLPVATGNNFFINAYLTTNLNSPAYVCSVQGQWFGAGQSYTCTGQLTLAKGTHVIRAWADPYATVTEEYETNNTRDLEVTNE